MSRKLYIYRSTINKGIIADMTRAFTPNQIKMIENFFNKDNCRYIPDFVITGNIDFSKSIRCHESSTIMWLTIVIVKYSALSYSYRINNPDGTFGIPGIRNFDTLEELINELKIVVSYCRLCEGSNTIVNLKEILDNA